MCLHDVAIDTLAIYSLTNPLNNHLSLCKITMQVRDNIYAKWAVSSSKNVAHG
eukprot:c39474_g1_i1 orf=383-541(-)